MFRPRKITSRSRPKSRVAPVRALDGRHLFAQCLAACDQFHQLSIEIGQCRPQFIEIHVEEHSHFCRPLVLAAHGYRKHISTATITEMSTSIKTYWTETLPDPLPANPLVVAAQWLAQARQDAAQPNPNAMVLATVDGRGYPSARVVLCKDIDSKLGDILFYTNYRSRKGRELEANRRAAIVFHWDHRHRQVRVEVVERLSDAENDAYFGTRAWQSRLGAWASEQSQPVESRCGA